MHDLQQQQKKKNAAVLCIQKYILDHILSVLHSQMGGLLEQNYRNLLRYRQDNPTQWIYKTVS